TFHHAIMDGHSLVLLLKEVFAYYEAFLNNHNLELPTPRPYRDYIEWLAEQDLSRAEAFWRATLKGFNSPTPLVVNRAVSASANDPEDDTEQEVYLSATFTSALRALAKEHDITLNNILQGAWASLLSRYSGEEDVVFGATRDCRHTALAGADSMV